MLQAPLVEKCFKLCLKKFPVKNIFALASRSSVGKEVSFGDDKILKVSSVDDFNFEKADIALFSAGSDIAKNLV